MKSHISRIITAGLGILFACFGAHAQARPSIDGTWKLNQVQSRFVVPTTAPKDLVVKLERRDRLLYETLTTLNSAGKSAVNLVYSLNGQDRVNNIDDERIVTRASWKGDTLLLEWKDDGGIFTRSLTFSDNGRTMNISVHDTNPEGEPDDLIVLMKQ